MNIQLHEEKTRIYLTGDTYGIKDQIKAVGGHWDGDRRAWWVGKGKKAAILDAIEAAKDGAADTDAAPEAEGPGDNAIVAGKAEYKGKTYYAAGHVYNNSKRRHYLDDRVEAITTRDGEKILLYSRDGKLKFWANINAVKVTKHYDRPQTIGGLAAFAAKVKEAETSGKGERRKCWECGNLYFRHEVEEWNAHGGMCYCGC